LAKGGVSFQGSNLRAFGENSARSVIFPTFCFDVGLGFHKEQERRWRMGFFQLFVAFLGSKGGGLFFAKKVGEKGNCFVAPAFYSYAGFFFFGKNWFVLLIGGFFGGIS